MTAIRKNKKKLNDKLRQVYKEKKQQLQDVKAICELEATIVRLEAERARLQPGAACPLCGSLEHPYLLQGLPASDNWQQVEVVRRRFTVTGPESLVRELISDIGAELGWQPGAVALPGC